MRLTPWLPIGMMFALFAAPALAKCPDELLVPLANMRGQVSELEKWLDEEGLSQKLEILRVRCAPNSHSDPHYGLRLDMRWLGPAETREKALADFAAFDADFSKVNADSLRHQLLNKTLDWSAAPPRDVSVHVHVLDTDMAAFVAPNGMIKVEDGWLRMVVRQSDFVLAGHVSPPATGLAPSASSAPPSQVLNESALATALQQHFGEKGRFQILDTSPTFVSFAVDKLRGEVTAGERWERLEGTLQLLHGTARNELMLHLDGRFAAGGIGDRVPDDAAFRDMEPQFTKQLDQYAQALLQSVKSHLSGSL